MVTLTNHIWWAVFYHSDHPSPRRGETALTMQERWGVVSRTVTEQPRLNKGRPADCRVGGDQRGRETDPKTKGLLSLEAQTWFTADPGP